VAIAVITISFVDPQARHSVIGRRATRAIFIYECLEKLRQSIRVCGENTRFKSNFFSFIVLFAILSLLDATIFGA